MKKSLVILSMLLWADFICASELVGSALPLIINEAGAIISSSDPVGCVPAIIERHLGPFAAPAKDVWERIAGQSVDEQIKNIYNLPSWNPNKKPEEAAFKGLMAGIPSSESRRKIFQELVRGVDLSRASCFDYFYGRPDAEQDIIYRSPTELKKVLEVGNRKVIITFSNVIHKEHIALVEASKKNGMNVEALQFYINSSDLIDIDPEVHLGTENIVGAEEGVFSKVWSFLGALSDLNFTKMYETFRTRDSSRAGGNTVDRARAALGRYYRNHPDRMATLVNMMHTHPHDAVKIVFADGKTQLIYPEVSREDLDALLSAEAALGIPVKVTAIIGVSHDTLSLMSIHLARPEESENP